MLKAIENHLTFKPNTVDHGGLSSLPHERVRFGSQFGFDLDGVWIPGRSSTTVLFIHGNRHNVTRFREHYELFLSLGLSCFAFDFPGYGSSKGAPSESSLYASARAALAHTIDSYGIEAKNLAVYGCSLGGAVAIDLAQSSSVGCLITESTFTNSQEIAKYLYPYLFIRHFLPTRFANDAKIAKVDAPKLMIHGTHDERVPAEMAHRLFSQAMHPKQIVMVENAGHIDCVSIGGEQLRSTVGTFISTHCQVTAPRLS